MRAIFLRGMGLVYLAAFGSLVVQIDGLIGQHGIAPAAELLEQLHAVLGRSAYWEFPTLFWIRWDDTALRAACWAGIVLGGLLTAGLMPGPCASLLWALYLSLVVVGQEFLGYQWDALLLESGLLTILIAPWSVVLSRASTDPPRVSVWLIRWLVFRLMLLSGLVKLASGDPTWRAWEALKYHYETQPLPTWTSWYMHQLPPWFQSWSVAVMFWCELISPFLIFGPRRLRLVGCASIVSLQLAIAATGNYGCFNLLSIVLCVSLLDDRDLGRKVPVAQPPRRNSPSRIALFVVAVVIVTVTTMEGVGAVWRGAAFPWPLEDFRRWVAPLRSMNAYGLFAVVTTSRPEIEIEGSRDGVTWLPYRFRWKPGEVDRRPRFLTPHMPRLDWQMWFAALAPSCRSQAWFLRFERRLLEGSPPVLRLLRQNPFPHAPPKYIRARLFLYRFTRRGSNDWWTRDEVGVYCPTVSLSLPSDFSN
jgi:hypothetical protein